MKKQLALVLAGGGSLGAYEVGAIKALEQLGYHFDIVTGTSIGALNGAFVFLGETDRLERLWFDITPEKVMVSGTNISKNYIINNKSSILREYAKWIKEYVSNGNIGADITPFKEYVKAGIDLTPKKHSKIKFYVTCSSFPSLKKVNVNMNEVDDDKFLPYLHASSACFPIFPVETIDDNKYVDGFYNDNLPMKLAIELGATDIIAIDMRLFSLDPTDDFFIGLPNVDYIAPYKPLGSMMDFGQDIIRKNMQLGYWDTMKYFRKMHGFASNIVGDIPDVKFLSFLLEKDRATSKNIIEEIKKGVNRPMYEEDYYIRALEIVAENLQIPMTYKKYTYRTFMNAIKKACLRVKEENESRKMLSRLFSELMSDTPLDEFLVDFIDTFILKDTTLLD